ncbi:hypothetical protein EV694_1300 [Volucribacter psittacicida]|uniref:Uncharacterized protein n=1 Tax=Volucribacter psittacicida TaxID=203482 RepID=A0A4R1FXB1_9PAST|nr:hypothetical protein [Volucribacter psittacicida]TCJ98870.1 hypothetical protein EV694_1300 [Volucribacter psittacicida]
MIFLSNVTKSITSPHHHFGVHCCLNGHLVDSHDDIGGDGFGGFDW